jgi:pimeloyl-ACP methyl ester carboxylesterase
VRLPDRPHHLGSLTAAPGADAVPGGGIDLDLPGRDGRLRATRWPGRSGTAGPPILLLHGLGGTRRAWDRVAPSLRPLPVLALDARGHGESADGRGYSLEACADDAATALDALGLSRVLAVGHSWGGAVALTLAARHRERVLGVVAIDGGFTPRRPPSEQAALRMQLLSPDASVAEREALDALLDLDPARVLPHIAVTCWLVACSPVETGVPSEWAAAKQAGLRDAAGMLAQPRLMSWAGAKHDVPWRWPALVTGLIRAAADDLAGGGT